MDAHKLVRMANQIGAFFAAEPDRNAALEGIVGHLKRFWDPRMRREILQWLDEHDGEGLDAIVREAIERNRESFLPQSAKRGLA